LEFRFEDIADNLVKGRSKNVRNLVRQALSEGVPEEEILKYGLLEGMARITETYKKGKVYVSEVLVAVQAMNAGVDALERYGQPEKPEPLGRVVIGTVSGDMHDIGKNLVAMMLRNNGFEVYDLGVDVTPKAFIDKAEEVDADIICISAMLTTTMPNIREVISRLVRQKLRHKYVVMVGGAPVTSHYSEKIGADYYTSDAADAVDVARKIMKEKRTGENFA